MRDLRLAAMAAAAVVCGSSAAQAATVVVNFEGVVKSGVDGAGIFSAPGSDLTGLTFTSSFTVYDFTDAPPGRLIDIDGGVGADHPSPVLDAQITINGITQHQSASYYGGLTDEYVVDYASTYFSLYAAAYPVFFGSDGLAVGCFASAPGPGTTSCAPSSGGLFSFADGATHGYLTTTTGASTYVVGLLPAPRTVPEPTAWAMMIVGFGLTGLALRGRKMLPIS